MGIQLEEVEVFRGKKVIGVLKDVEKAYPLVGTSLVGLFFPGSLRVAEDKEFEFWQGAFQQRYAPNKHGRCVGVAPPEADSLSQGLPEKPTEGGGKNRGGQVLTTGTSDIPAKCLHDR